VRAASVARQVEVRCRRSGRGCGGVWGRVCVCAVGCVQMSKGSCHIQKAQPRRRPPSGVFAFCSVLRQCEPAYNLLQQQQGRQGNSVQWRVSQQRCVQSGREQG